MTALATRSPVDTPRNSGADHFPHPTTVPAPDDSDPSHTEIRSPSPKRHANLLGLGIASQSGTGGADASTRPSVLATYPHLGHYIFTLVTTNQTSPARHTTSSSTNLAASQHPLSVSSSGESDDDDDDDIVANTSADDSGPERTPRKVRPPPSSATSGPSHEDKEELVRTIVNLLDSDQEEELRVILRPFMGDLAKDEILMDQVCLDCMHRRRDDIEQLPYAPHITPSRARASPSLTTLPLRPYTPTRVPSFRARTPLGRPQSPSRLPSGSGAQTPTLYRTMSGLSREAALSTSPPGASGSGLALPIIDRSGSPITSPRILNAKASAFSPNPRVVSAPSTSSSGIFSPSDPWKDAPVEVPRTASPFGAIGPIGMTRSGSNRSNLAIATPLFSGQSSPFHSPMGTPNKGTVKMPEVIPVAGPSTTTPAARPVSRSFIPDDDDDDAFSPFGSGLPKLHHHEESALSLDAKSFEPANTDIFYGSASTLSSSIPQSDSSHSHGSGESGTGALDGVDEYDMTSGMTPLDVLSSVFSTVPREQLEDALHRSGYDFEGAMAMLVSQHTLPRSGSSTPQRVSSPRPLLGMNNRGGIPSNHFAPKEGYFQQGGRAFSGGNLSPGLNLGPRSPGGQATRMCRYFLAGECRRADCRFSHDLDRALCRFWLRGHCAKGPNCEFLHHFPNNVDPHALSNAMSRVELGADGSASGSVSTPPGGYGAPDEFPDLFAQRLGRGVRFDPTRNRFANAVKRVPPGAIAMPSVQVTGARMGMPAGQPFSPGEGSRSHLNSTALAPPAPAIPRPSTRIKLRPPTLLPTLTTGSAVNEQYMAARATAIRLGHARNACLARASDAFRRGDGAAAKRFSREGRSLNERMLTETLEAAQTLVRERQREAQSAVRNRDPSWSDDPSDRAVRGRDCGSGWGVIMGIASARSVPSGPALSSDERTEALLDLHTLHGGEGTEILSQWLGELERESFRGLAYVVVGSEKHVGTQDAGRGASKVRLASSVKTWLAEWSYAWSESGGVICVDPVR